MFALYPLVSAALAALVMALAAPTALGLADEPAARSETESESPTIEQEAKPSEPEEGVAEAPPIGSGESVDSAKSSTDDALDAAAEPKGPAEPEQPAEPEKKAALEPSTAGSSTAPADAQYVLAYKFKKGEVIRWEVVHRAVVDTTIQGTNQTAETRSTSIKAWQVTDVAADGSITLVHSVESIDMWQKMQGRQEVRYNSRTDEKVPAGYEDIAKAVGVPLTVVTIDVHGGVLKREEKHRQSNASNMPLTIPLPAEPVAVGYSWNVPADVDVILHGGATRKIQTRQKYVLEKVVDGLATIGMETQVLTPLNDPAIEAQLVQRFTNGTLRFDLERGRVVSQQMDLDRRVVGFSGTSSSMHYLTRFTEELLSDTSPVVMKKPPAPAAAPKPAVAAKPPAQPAQRPAATAKPPGRQTRR